MYVFTPEVNDGKKILQNTLIYLKIKKKLFLFTTLFQSGIVCDY